MSKKFKIIWADDEINSLKPHVMFLESKGYEVDTCNSGDEAIDKIQNNSYDLLLLDESMPGITGLEVIAQLDKADQSLPIVMVTKNEDESIMDEAIGSRIADYVLKPINPNQIWLSVKKVDQGSVLFKEKVSMDYQKEFMSISSMINQTSSFEDWAELYKTLVNWFLKLSQSKSEQMSEIFESQKEEATSLFTRFVKRNYKDWLYHTEDAPLLSHRLFKERVAPELSNDSKVFFLVIDNFRYDQWKVIAPALSEHYQLRSEEIYCSILPTVTQFARNAIFAGMMPGDIAERLPQYWVHDNEEGGKNLCEKELLEHQLAMLNIDIKHDYFKTSSVPHTQRFLNDIHEYQNHNLVTVVYNFVDMLSHSRTGVDIIKELAINDRAYLSLTESWFGTSLLMNIIRKMGEMGFTLILTTDHGMINIKDPIKIVGERNTNTNLRYKHGNRLSSDKERELLHIQKPAEYKLPQYGVGFSYMFAEKNQYFCYPNNFNHFVRLYNQTYQHGGVSLEEMLIPICILDPK